MVKPTESEILALAVETGMRVRTGKGAVNFARAVLDKWGQPARGAEPILYDPKALLEAFKTAQAGSSGTAGILRGIAAVIASWESRAEPHTWLIASPQPVVREPLTDSQAQAGAVPLTREQVKAILTECGYDGASAQHRADFISGLRHGEAAHGIKEGQHG